MSVPTSKFCQNSIVAGGTEVRNNKDEKGLNASVSCIHTVSKAKCMGSQRISKFPKVRS